MIDNHIIYSNGDLTIWPYGYKQLSDCPKFMATKIRSVHILGGFVTFTHDTISHTYITDTKIRYSSGQIIDIRIFLYRDHFYEIYQCKSEIKTIQMDIYSLSIKKYIKTDKQLFQHSIKTLLYDRNKDLVNADEVIHAKIIYDCHSINYVVNRSAYCDIIIVV